MELTVCTGGAGAVEEDAKEESRGEKNNLSQKLGFMSRKRALRLLLCLPGPLSPLLPFEVSPEAPSGKQARLSRTRAPFLDAVLTPRGSQLKRIPKDPLHSLDWFPRSGYGWIFLENRNNHLSSLHVPDRKCLPCLLAA